MTKEIARIKLDKEFCTLLEGYHFKNIRAQQIVAFMLSSNYDITSEAFRRYEEKQEEYVIKEEKMKDYISKNIIPPEIDAVGSRWEVDFDAQEVVVYGE